MALIRNIRIFFLIIILSSLSLSADVWQRVEGVYSKVQTEILISYQNNLYLQSKTPKQKIFIQTNNNWYIKSNNFLSNLGRILTFKQNNNTAFVSSINGNFRSFDNGENWELIDSLYLYNVVISDSVIFGQGQPTKDKLYKLDPNSKIWKPVTFLNNENEIDTVIADHLESKNNLLIAGDAAYLNTHKGVYISIDYGKNWYKSKTFTGEIASLQIQNDIIFIGASNKHLYKSIDYGESWDVDTSKTLPIDKFISTDLGLIAAVNKIAELNGGESGIHLSKDNGKTWEKINVGFEDRTIAQFEEVNNEIYALDSKNHVFKYSSQFNKWILQEILYDSLPCYDIVLSEDTLYTIGWLRGILFSTDGGEKWSILNEMLDNNNLIYSSVKKNKKNFVLDKNGYYILLSSDSGKNWNSYSTPNSSQSSPSINDILLIDDRILLSTDYGIIYSNDFSRNWNQLYGGVLDSGDFTSKLYLDGNSLYVFTLKGLLKSNDRGLSWELYYGKDKYIKNQTYIYDIFDNEIFILNDSSEIIKFNVENNKETLFFKSRNKNILPSKILKFNEYFIVILNDTIFISDDNGKIWKNFSLVSVNQNSKSNRIRNLVSYKDYLIAATDYGIWRAKLNDLGIEVKSSVESEIERNYLYTYPPYPNPAKSEVKVLFYWDINLPMTTKDISIYDITGKKIDASDKINLVKQANHYGHLIWDCSTAQSGIYLINIKHGTEEKVVKVVVE